MDLLTWIRNQWDRVGAWALIAAGAVALLAGWLGVSRSPLTVEQMAYVVSGGIGAIFLLGLGATLWLSADLRDEWRVLDEIRRDQRALLDQTVDGGEPAPAADRPLPRTAGTGAS